jgi:hypothetical protein
LGDGFGFLLAEDANPGAEAAVIAKLKFVEDSGVLALAEADGAADGQ